MDSAWEFHIIFSKRLYGADLQKSCPVRIVACQKGDLQPHHQSYTPQAIYWFKVQNFADSHSAPGHQLQHKPVSDIHGPKDDLIDGFLVDYLPLNGLRTFEYLFYNCCVAGIVKSWQASINAEIVER